MELPEDLACTWNTFVIKFYRMTSLFLWMMQLNKQRQGFYLNLFMEKVRKLLKSFSLGIYKDNTRSSLSTIYGQINTVASCRCTNFICGTFYTSSAPPGYMFLCNKWWYRRQQFSKDETIWISVTQHTPNSYYKWIWNYMCKVLSIPGWSSGESACTW